MISCLLIHVSRNPQGLAVCKDSVITGETIQIGRGAACKIHLLDHRVSLLHATILHAEDGELYIEGEREVTLKVNGFIAQSAPFVPGTHVEIGPYELVVEPAAKGHDIVVSVELIHPLNDHDAAIARQTVPVTLVGLGISKRLIGLSMAACILFLFLLLPMLPGMSHAFDKWQASLPITLTGAWNPGQLAGGHALFAAQCSTCHQRPFQPVSDEACISCHKQVTKHVAKDALQVGVFKGSRCTDCHIDHQGRERLVLQDSSECVACHGDIKRLSANTTLANVRDFTVSHPAFKIALYEGKTLIRIRQGDKTPLLEKSGLKYSHKVHLAKEGVSSPQGDTVMRCQDCHLLEESGRHFAPMTMKKTCQQSDCHALEFTAPVEGIVPHGSERAVMNHLRVFYSKWLSESPNAECAQLVGVVSACANQLAVKNAATTLFRKNDECGECHEIQASDDSEISFIIKKININRDWQPGAVFSHAKHGTVNCTDCHDKINSTRSADISMPAIKKCRECHVDNHPAQGKVTGNCDSCHLFHQSVK
jgi:predicted CXXCH cytochrome family protein